MEFSKQEYWSGLPCPSPGDLPRPGSPVLQAEALPSEPPGKPEWHHDILKMTLSSERSITLSYLWGFLGDDWFLMQTVSNSCSWYLCIPRGNSGSQAETCFIPLPLQLMRGDWDTRLWFIFQNPQDLMVCICDLIYPWLCLGSLSVLSLGCIILIIVLHICLKKSLFKTGEITEAKRNQMKSRNENLHAHICKTKAHF